MKLYVFAVAISIVSISITASSADICYQHYDKNGQLIDSGRKPPFDISGPPLSLEYQAARDRGEYIVIAPSNSCSSPDKRTYPVKPISKQGTVRTMTANEYDEYRRQHPPEPLPTDTKSIPSELKKSSAPSYQSSPSYESYSSKTRRSGGGGKGCGSRGGPGYRLPSGKCASWKD
jgi:hypothetical protein